MFWFFDKISQMIDIYINQGQLIQVNCQRQQNLNFNDHITVQIKFKGYMILQQILIIIIVQLTMQYEKTLKKILVRLVSNQKNKQQKYIELDIELQHDQINLSQILIDFVNRQLIPPKSQVFYLHPFQKFYIFVGDFIHHQIKLPQSLILAQNTLFLFYKKCTISDEALANPNQKQKKRSKQRTIKQVIKCCKQWRKQYHQGIINQKGETQKVTLDQSANMVGVSRKTLEDYYLQLKNGMKFEFDFYKYKDEKMGILRNFVKEKIKNNMHTNENSNLTKWSKNQEQEQTFAYIQKCLKQKQEERLFYFEEQLIDFIRFPSPNLTKSQKMKNQESSSSDEHFLFDEQ